MSERQAKLKELRNQVAELEAEERAEGFSQPATLWQIADKRNGPYLVTVAKWAGVDTAYVEPPFSDAFANLELVTLGKDAWLTAAEAIKVQYQTLLQAEQTCRVRLLQAGVEAEAFKTRWNLP